MLNKEKHVTLTIDKEKCIKCGKCVAMCPSEYLLFKNGEVTENKEAPFGCIQCGNCMMSCPKSCINVSYKDFSQKDVMPLSNNIADYDSMHSLFFKRRSIRKFKNKELTKETIDKILDSASTAPIGIPPSEVKVLVINGFDKVQTFAKELLQGFKTMLKIFNPVMLRLFYPLLGKVQYKIMKDFVVPLAKKTIESAKNSEDVLFYNAPAVIVFYSSEYSEAEDPIIAATFATIVAESMKLGTCIIGSCPELLRRNKKLRQKYGIAGKDKIHMAFIVGYPDVSYTKGIRRRFKDVRYF